MEILSQNVQAAQSDGLLYGIKLSRTAPPLSHLLFADDSVFFLLDKEEAFSKLKVILDSFCCASGQIMNENKSGIIFSLSTTMRSVQEGLSVLHILQNRGIGRYLGIETDFGSSKKTIFNALIETVKQRISSWNGIFLSSAGRLTLISSVLSALSNYVLSVFKIPVSVTNKTNSLFSYFWWVGTRSRSSIHWCSKNFTSLPKSKGGLDIQNIKCMNQAILGKLAWKVLYSRHSLISRVFYTKLIRHNNLVLPEALKACSSQSWGCKSLSYGMELILPDLGWKAGTCSNLDIWNTNWVSGSTPANVTSLGFPPPGSMMSMTVKDLMTPSFRWKHDLINVLFDFEWANKICAMPVCATISNDCIFWKHTPSGDLFGQKWLGISTEYSTSVRFRDWIVNWINYFHSKDDSTNFIILFLSFIWSLWRVQNEVIFSGKSFSVDYFFNVQASTANVVMKAESLASSKASTMGLKLYDPMDTLRSDIRNHFPFFLVGEKGTCTPYRAKVDASWVDSLHAAVGWVVYSPDGESVCTFARSFKAESVFQAEAFGIRELLI
ncbi:uncharacterized protein LOC141613158 [Silene latifolia]|uniref:uncharacterized protein LOC141613158 n=1 Tax=Silene latifolia TaxID=37657 RepID=UPI003D771855